MNHEMKMRAHKHRACAGMELRLSRYRMKRFAWMPSLHWHFMYTETHRYGFRLIIRQVDGPVAREGRCAP